MSLDDLFAADDVEPAGPPRGRLAAQTFVLAVVAALIGVVLLSLVLYGLGAGVVALWDHWWSDFG